MKTFSIGEFAFKCGVTSDFIKYYEKRGLLFPQVNESGYRYFDATNTPYINECIKLKNWGFSAKEIETLLKSTGYSKTVSLIHNRQSELEKQILFLQGLLAYGKEMSESLTLYDSPTPWNIKTRDSLYYLGQSRCFDFFPDEKRYVLLKDWLRWMPVTCTTARVDSREEKASIDWGFTVPKDFAEKIGIPLDHPVELIPETRCLEFYDRRLLPDDQDNDDLEQVRIGMFVNVQKVIDRHRFEVTGPSCFLVQTKMREGSSRYTYQKILVPIR